MSNQYQYQSCRPNYHSCQISTRAEEKTMSKKQVLSSDKPTINHPNPFSPHGGAREWCSNDLILRDTDLRRLARVRPLDCGIRDLYMINPTPKL